MLSFGIPFALVPTILLTRRRDLMGGLVNRRAPTAVASVVAGLIIALYGFLLYGTFSVSRAPVTTATRRVGSLPADATGRFPLGTASEPIGELKGLLARVERAGTPPMADDSPAARIELFRDAMAALASGVAVVTARRADGSPAGLLATSIAAYSAAPPSVLLSIAHTSRSHPTLVEDAERFGVHLLGRHQEALARTFASRSHDKYAELGWSWDHEVPRLEGVVSYLRCGRSATFDRYDHSIVIGDVLGGHHAGGDPLLWVRRRMDWRLSPEG